MQENMSKERYSQIVEVARAASDQGIDKINALLPIYRDAMNLSNTECGMLLAACLNDIMLKITGSLFLKSNMTIKDLKNFLQGNIDLIINELKNKKG